MEKNKVIGGSVPDLAPETYVSFLFYDTFK